MHRACGMYWEGLDQGLGVLEYGFRSRDFTDAKIHCGHQ